MCRDWSVVNDYIDVDRDAVASSESEWSDNVP